MSAITFYGDSLVARQMSFFVRLTLLLWFFKYLFEKCKICKNFSWRALDWQRPLEVIFKVHIDGIWFKLIWYFCSKVIKMLVKHFKMICFSFYLKKCITDDVTCVKYETFNILQKKRFFKKWDKTWMVSSKPFYLYQKYTFHL
jgi:hypothetical protein